MTMQQTTGRFSSGRLLTGAPAYAARTPWSWWSAIGMGFVVLIAATALSIPIAIGAMTIGTPDLGRVFGDEKAVRSAFEAPVVMAATMLGWQVAIVLFTLLIARWYGGLRREVLALQTFPQVMILNLRLQVENAQLARRREAQERGTGSGMDQKVDQEVAFADLRRTADYQNPTGG